jgi:hypothetical protein
MRQRQHGTIKCYQQGPVHGVQGPGCRCDECRRSWSIYNKRLRRRHLRGEQIAPTVDATEAREHLRYLQSRNVGQHWLEHATGLSRPTIGQIRDGRKQRIRPQTAAAIMAVGLRDCPHALLDREPTRQRIAELRQHGWTQQAIKEVVGDWRKARKGYITVRMAEAIEALWIKEAS